MENLENIKQNTTAYKFQVWVSFIISLALTVGGIAYLPTDLWTKGYLFMGIFFTVGSCFTLAKTIRDDHESEKLFNRIQQAKTQRILKEFES